jgi:hypothetical protein
VHPGTMLGFGFKLMGSLRESVSFASWHIRPISQSISDEQRASHLLGLMPGSTCVRGTDVLMSMAKGLDLFPYPSSAYSSKERLSGVVKEML